MGFVERLQRLFHDGAFELNGMMSIAPTASRATCVTQIRVHKSIRGHKVGCPLRTSIVRDRYAEGKTVQSGRLQFSGLALLAYMHVGFRMFDPKGDAGTGLDREYEAAVKMRRER